MANDNWIEITTTITGYSPPTPDDRARHMLREVTHTTYIDAFPDPHERAVWLRWMARLDARQRADPSLLTRDVTTPPIMIVGLSVRFVGRGAAGALLDRAIYARRHYEIAAGVPVTFPLYGDE